MTEQDSRSGEAQESPDQGAAQYVRDLAGRLRDEPTAYYKEAETALAEYADELEASASALAASRQALRQAFDAGADAANGREQACSGEEMRYNDHDTAFDRFLASLSPSGGDKNGKLEVSYSSRASEQPALGERQDLREVPNEKAASDRGWVKVQWDTTTTLLPAETSYDELCIHNPFGEMFDRRLHLNGEPLPFEGPIELKDGDTLLSVPRGYY